MSDIEETDLKHLQEMGLKPTGIRIDVVGQMDNSMEKLIGMGLFASRTEIVREGLRMVMDKYRQEGFLTQIWG